MKEFSICLGGGATNIWKIPYVSLFFLKASLNIALRLSSIKSSPPPLRHSLFQPFVILIQRVRKQVFFKHFCFVTSKRQALVDLRCNTESYSVFPSLCLFVAASDREILLTNGSFSFPIWTIFLTNRNFYHLWILPSMTLQMEI